MTNTGFSTKVRQLIYKRSRGVCEGCGMRMVAYQIHHRRPRGMGGSDDPLTNTSANGLHFCYGCHDGAEKHRQTALDRGWLVPQGVDPASVPVRLFDGLYLLDAAGKRQKVEMP